MDNISIEFRVNSIRNYLRFAKQCRLNVLLIVSGHVKNFHLPSVARSSDDVCGLMPLHKDIDHAAYEIHIDHTEIDSVMFDEGIVSIPTYAIRSIYDCSSNTHGDTRQLLDISGSHNEINEISIRKIVIVTDNKYKYVYNYPVEYLIEEIELSFNNYLDELTERKSELLQFPVT